MLTVVQGDHNLDLALIICQLFSAVLMGAGVLTEPVGSAYTVVGWLLQMDCT